MKKRLVTVLIIILIISVVPFSLSAKEITIKLAHLNAQQPFDIPSAAMTAAFKSAVEANSNGEIKVELYPSGVLGKERETMVQVKSGVVQSYISSTGGMSTFYPMIDITNMPFAFSSYNVGYKVYDGSFGKAFAADIERKSGFHVLGFGESGGFFVITNSKREIRSPRDMKGIKIRTMTVPLHMEIIKSLGGSPTPISWSEVYTSLQTGVVDGQMNPVSIINMAKFYEVQKYATLTNHIYAPYIWVMNARFYNSLSPAHKAIIDDAAKTHLGLTANIRKRKHLHTISNNRAFFNKSCGMNNCRTEKSSCLKCVKNFQPVVEISDATHTIYCPMGAAFIKLTQLGFTAQYRQP